jgi:hypothetical protein
MATSGPAPSATATWHEECVLSQTPCQKCAKDLLCWPTSVWNHLHVSRSKHRLQLGGDRSAYQRVHSELSHTLRSMHGLGLLDSRFFAADLGSALDVHDQQAPCDVEHGGNPVAPRWNADSHRWTVCNKCAARLHGAFDHCNPLCDSLLGQSTCRFPGDRYAQYAMSGFMKGLQNETGPLLLFRGQAGSASWIPSDLIFRGPA